MLSEAEAIELAQQFLFSQRGNRGIVKFAHFIPARSSDPLDGYYPEPRWAVFFSIPVEGFEPNFFVLHVNCHTREVTDSPVM
jgi:hypothetical protein